MNSCRTFRAGVQALHELVFHQKYVLLSSETISKRDDLPCWNKGSQNLFHRTLSLHKIFRFWPPVTPNTKLAVYILVMDARINRDFIYQ